MPAAQSRPEIAAKKAQSVAASTNDQRLTAARLARVREAQALVAKADAMLARSDRIDAWLARGAPLDDIPA